jgi:hypothetical protein
MVNFWDVVQFGQIGQLVNHHLQKLKVNIFITKFMVFSLPFLSLVVVVSLNIVGKLCEAWISMSILLCCGTVQN